LANPGVVNGVGRFFASLSFRVFGEKIYFNVYKTQEGKRLGRTIEDARREILARILEAFKSVRPEQWRTGQSGKGSLTCHTRPPGRPFVFTDGVLNGWTAERLRFEQLTPIRVSFCRPAALAPTPGTGRRSQSR
jgi:hypothetical protein